LAGGACLAGAAGGAYTAAACCVPVLSACAAYVPGAGCAVGCTIAVVGVFAPTMGCAGAACAGVLVLLCLRFCAIFVPLIG
jgi:hypothetical protein